MSGWRTPLEMTTRLSRYLQSIRNALPGAARLDLDRVFEGNAAAARPLVEAAPRRLVGHMAYLAYLLKVPNPAYRELIGAVWCAEPGALADFWPAVTVRRMLESAAFQLPEIGTGVIAHRAGTWDKRRLAAGLVWYPARHDALRFPIGPQRRRPAAIVTCFAEREKIIFWGESGGALCLVMRQGHQSLSARVRNHNAPGELLDLPSRSVDRGRLGQLDGVPELDGATDTTILTRKWA